MTNLELANQFINAVIDGDEEAARNCMHPDALIWHNYDGVEQTVDDNMATMQLMIEKTSEREYQLHRIDEVEGGYVQRHTLHLTSLDGSSKASTEALALVTVNDDQITRIEEFIDPTPLLAMLRG